MEFTSTRIVGKDIHFVRVPTGCALACALIAPNEEAAKFVPRTIHQRQWRGLQSKDAID
jgi:hypothetical protein